MELKTHHLLITYAIITVSICAMTSRYMELEQGPVAIINGTLAQKTAPSVTSCVHWCFTLGTYACNTVNYVNGICSIMLTGCGVPLYGVTDEFWKIKVTLRQLMHIPIALGTVL